MLRQREELSEETVSHIMLVLLKILSSGTAADPESNDGAVGNQPTKYDNLIQVGAARCLINLIFDHEKNIQLLCSHRIDGMGALACVLETSPLVSIDTVLPSATTAEVEVQMEASNSLHYYITHMIYMMIAQRLVVL